VVNWGAFSRDFVAGFRAGGDIVLRADENARRDELAKAAEKRAQAAEGRAAGRYAREEADRAAEDAYFGGQGALADKAAAAAPAPTGGSGGRSRAGGMPAPNMLGAVTADGTPVPVGPDEAAADEASEGAMARERGFTPAPPAKVGANNRAKYGDNPETLDEEPAPRASGLPAYKGRITPAIARDMREREELKFNQGIKTRELDDRLKTNEVARRASSAQLDEASFGLTERKLKQLNNGITAKIQGLDGIDDATPLLDGRVQGQVDSLIDDLKRFHAATPDGKSVQVNPTKAGYEVIEVDDDTGQPISKQLVTSVGQLRDFGRITGVLAQGENFGTYIAGTMGDKMAKTIAASKAISEEAKLESQEKIGMFLDREKLLDPEYRKQMEAEALRLAALMGDEAYDKYDDVVSDPETGRSTKVTRKENRFIKMMQLSTPKTSVETPKGSISAEQFVKVATAKPQDLLREAGSIDAVPAYVAAQMETRGFPPETAQYYGQLAAKAVQQATAGALQQAATPAPTANAVPTRTGPVNPRNPAQGLPRIDPATGQPMRTARGQPIYN
jgi:hypothetical protein